MAETILHSFFLRHGVYNIADRERDVRLFVACSVQ